MHALVLPSGPVRITVGWSAAPAGADPVSVWQKAGGSVMGYEALARPEGFAALDSVEAVFEAARTNGQIRDLDWVCRRRAVEDAKQLPEGIALFLNISAAALLDPVHGVDQLLLLLHAAERAPQTVVLEITESERIRDYEVLGRVLSSYRAEGIRFALDDVGEGHSTLELLP
jgi:EAL domain-containing protein (putative c-di-GMP-specific phosphodiesterase class I)